MGQGTSCYSCLVTNKPIVTLERQSYRSGIHKHRSKKSNKIESGLMMSSVLYSEGNQSSSSRKIVMKSIIKEEESRILHKDNPLFNTVHSKGSKQPQLSQILENSQSDILVQSSHVPLKDEVAHFSGFGHDNSQSKKITKEQTQNLAPNEEVSVEDSLDEIVKLDPEERRQQSQSIYSETSLRRLEDDLNSSFQSEIKRIDNNFNGTSVTRSRNNTNMSKESDTYFNRESNEDDVDAFGDKFFVQNKSGNIFDAEIMDGRKHDSMTQSDFHQRQGKANYRKGSGQSDDRGSSGFNKKGTGTIGDFDGEYQRGGGSSVSSDFIFKKNNTKVNNKQKNAKDDDSEGSPNRNSFKLDKVQEDQDSDNESLNESRKRKGKAMVY